MIDLHGCANLNNWRYERKFLVSQLSKEEIIAVVKSHPAMFSEIHHERNVNNIYLDTVDMANFFKSVDGQSQRVKARIRWYDDLLGEINSPVLELKIKSGYLGTKRSYRLAGFTLNEAFTNETLRDIFRVSDLPEDIRYILKSYNYSLLNSYTRKYYQSADKKFRITLDWGMRYIQLSNLYNSYSNELDDSSHHILELKYAEEEDELARGLTTLFPFRVTKSSKYVTGIERLLGTKD